MFERKVWRLFAFFTPLSAPLCAFYVFCLSPNKFLLLFLFGVVPKTAFLLLFTPFPLRGGPKSSWPGGRPRHFFKHFWPSPETRLGTVVDSGPLPGDGRTNFAVAGPGAFWNDFGQIADHRRDDRERGCSSLAPGRPCATLARPRARRPQGRRLPAGALLLRGVSCSLRPAPPCRGSTQARRAAGGLQHACARSGLCARARARGPPPGTGVGEAHTRLADDPLGPARGQQTRCVRARPAAHLVFSLSHRHTHCCQVDRMNYCYEISTP